MLGDDRKEHHPVSPRTFVAPDDIFNAADLCPDEKILLLRQWEQDLRQQMIASREGMSPLEPNQVPDTLRRVRALVRELADTAE